MPGTQLDRGEPRRGQRGLVQLPVLLDPLRPGGIRRRLSSNERREQDLAHIADRKQEQKKVHAGSKSQILLQAAAHREELVGDLDG